MTTIRFNAMPTEFARAYQNGAFDANGQLPERHISDGDGVPCRHCLQDVAAGEPYLILAYRPFPEAQPYAELGPIFLHAETCERYVASDQVPPVVARSQRMLIRGYNAQNRIVYGTGQVVAVERIQGVAATLFERPEIAYIHVRSASNNCYSCRIDR
ncbi:MAG: DUF1203 domain-containing protein [Caldilineaceae bacterium]